MSHDLHDLLHDAAVRPADDLDTEALHARVSQIRRRRQAMRGIQAAVVGIVLIAVVVTATQMGTRPDVAVDNPTGSPTEHVSATDEAPVPATPRTLVAEGRYQGSDDTWQLYAWWTTEGESCLEGPHGVSCGPPPADTTPGSAGALLQTNLSSSYDDGGWSGCIVSAVDERVSTVEVIFWGGRTSQVTPVVPDDPRLGANIAIFCWSGHHTVLGARALDPSGTVIGTWEEDQLDRTIDVPVAPDDVWRRVGGAPTRDDTVAVRRGPEHCDWDQALLLDIAWPLGTEVDEPDSRQYVRDPANVLPQGQLQDQFTADTTLPSNAEFSGYSTERAQLWIDPATADTRAYIVTLDHVEQWPRMQPPAVCR